MKRGLVIGKFMPVHKGHLALIKFAAAQCDELIVSMSFTSNDPISPDLRKIWLVELLKDQPHIKVETIPDDFDDERLNWPERTKVWADVLGKRYPPFQYVFSSEAYGDFLAQHLNATSIIFDSARLIVPVSATQIRKNPIHFWDFIPKIVQPYFVTKVCLYGPESTGKSTMAKHLAVKFNTEFVPEVARELITSNEFTVEDIIKIGHAQADRIKQKLKTANRFLFCDTDLITTQIYSNHYLKVVPPILFELEQEIQYDHYFLFDIDVPWIQDGLRDLGNNRKEMMVVFQEELSKRNIKPTLVRGDWHQREEIIIQRLTQIESQNLS